MKKLVLVFALLIFGLPVLAAEGMATHSFDVSQYNPREVDFVKATISSMSTKGWSVDSYEKGRLTGKYKEKHVIEVLFDGKNITINETSGRGGFRTTWLESLERLMNNGLAMQQYIRQAEKY